MWNAVRWTLAGQVARQFRLSERSAALLVEEDRPEAFFAMLRKAGAHDDALAFLSFALPRRPAIVWGLACARKTAGSARLSPADTAAHSAVAAWLEDASDERRRTAYEAAMAAQLQTPEALLALAVYASGGSMSATQSPQQIPPPPNLANQVVSSAVLVASVRVPPVQIPETKALFLDLGTRYASGDSP